MSNKKSAPFLLILLVAFTALIVVGCSNGDSGSSSVKGDNSSPSDQFANGAFADVQIEKVAGGYYATSIDVAESNDASGNESEDTSDDYEDFSGQVESIAPDGLSFTTFSGLIVMEEADNGSGDAEQPDDLGIADLQIGDWVECVGNFGYTDPGETDGETSDGPDNVFIASQIQANDGGAEYSMNSIILNLTDNSFTMLGVTIQYDSNTKLNPETNDD